MIPFPPSTALRAAALALLVLVGGCVAPARPLTPPSAPPPPGLSTAVHVHYRAFSSAAELAAYLRPDTGPLVSARRGGPRLALPENSLAAFEHALNHAPALLETDLRVTADGHLVLLHDSTVDRTTTGEGPVSAFTLAALRELRLLDPLGRPTPHRVPTLTEALAWAEGRAILVLNPQPGVEPARLVEAIRQADATNRAVVATDTHDQLQAYLDLERNLIFSVSAETPEDVETLVQLHDPAYLIGRAGAGTAPPGVIERFHEAGVMVQLSTSGATDAAARTEGPSAFYPLLEQGADVILTDAVSVAALAIRQTHPASPVSAR